MNQNYLHYFGLTQAPFSIAPNPNYLYMSNRHKEALAHLSYGFGESGGFVLLTGEVGTGKTTLSKRLLSQLPDNTQAAFILNPTLSAYELSATICDELDINYQTSASVKDLSQAIYQHLLSNHEAERHTLLVIDEAQHLQPAVLEQLRLLTNLETDTKKLLQVILIGQPELQHLLKRQDLRQLAQRITARYHLLPLNLAETKQYINYRLGVGGTSESLFDDKAIALIQRFSTGVPRLINLLCDRALLGAYASQQKRVDKSLVINAAAEVLNLDTNQLVVWKKTWLRYALAATVLVGVVTCSGLLGQRQYQQQQSLFTQTQQQLNVEQQRAVEREQNRIPTSLINQSRSLRPAFEKLYQQWHIRYAVGNSQSSTEQQTACDVALSYQLQCHWSDGSLDTLLSLSHRAIVVLYDDNDDPFYAVVEPSQHTDLLQLHLATESIWVNKHAVASRFKQQALLLWQPPTDFVETLDKTLSNELLVWLETALANAQQRLPRQGVAYDAIFVNQLSQFQQGHQTPLSDIETVIALSRYTHSSDRIVDDQVVNVTPQATQSNKATMDPISVDLATEE
ncbi:AAA family ATPase [Thalassotalea ponticola]|uniref:ExeA family protein n=1 Tax=Thalassotalea ponticola TaxID=1523392 RepID=UPI0025B3E483|nr:AAA family ATPase [Thalassotalea ponticola]MDN3651962.1 AAA family ATPase [Thalassotalea ponticola]